MAELIRILACVMVLATTGAAAAQEEESAPPANEGEAVAVELAPEEREALEAFAPIQADFANLYESLKNRQGIRAGDEPAIRALHERVLAYRERWPDEVHGAAADYQLSTWLGEDEGRLEELRGQLLVLLPENVRLRVEWAEGLRREQRYEAALALMEEAEFDRAEDAGAAALLAQLYFAQHRFEEAQELVEGISEEALAENASAQQRVGNLRPVVESYVKYWQEEQDIRGAEAEDDDLPRVEIVVRGRGRIVAELFENEAPNTVANFISLAERDFYAGCTFHRVIPTFMAQGGDPNTKPEGTGLPGTGGPGYYIPDEHNTDEARRHFTGSLSMANSGPNTQGSQFFITFEPTHWLNGQHTVFGRVIEGQEVAWSIEKGDVIESLTVVRKRDHEYRPTLLAETRGLPEGPPAPPVPPMRQPGSTENVREGGG